MKLFSFGKKNKTNGIVWRDSNGNIICPGDSCPKDCDDTCPIYLNTQAVILMQVGQDQKAIQIYDKALKIAPDFYDAWNNLGGIYGQIGNYQKSYECYNKAHNLNKTNPNPVYGLIMTSRDLDKFEECLSWCDLYKTLSKDGREQAVCDEIKKKREVSHANKQTDLANGTGKSKDKKEIIKSSAGNKYHLVKYNDFYVLGESIDNKIQYVKTPGGTTLRTNYYILAERLFEDIQKYGKQCKSAESLLPWHYTMCENFSKMEHKELEDMLDSCFMQKPDWTYVCCDDTWTTIFGNQTERVTEIQNWLSKCTHMQMTAACCIGNAYHSINIAFVLASIMETYSGKDRNDQFKQLADFITKNSFYGPASDIIKDFNNFDFYYGIHLDQEGPIINVPSVGLITSTDESANVLCSFMKQSKEIIDTNGMEFHDINEFFESKSLCKDIYDFCKKHYGGSYKTVEEYFITAYYASLCLTIHHIKDENSFSREEAFQFLQSQCDTEFCDVYSERLLGYKFKDSDSEAIWGFYLPLLQNIVNHLTETKDESEESIYSAMEASFALGISVAFENYVPTVETESKYAGEHLTIEALVGRNYYHYTNGEQDKKQPLIVITEGVEIDNEMDEDSVVERDFEVSLSAFISKSCWIKKISYHDGETEINRIIEIETDEKLNILNVTEILDEVQTNSFGMIMIPGIETPVKHSYEIQDCLSDETEKEIDLLLKQRIVPQKFSLIGKKLPQTIIDEEEIGGDNTNYTYVVQSVYRRAYMHMSIDTTEDGVIEEINYSTYKSTGSGYWDMFSRPQGLDDKHEEVVDMLLYILDRYTDEEYADL